MKQEDEPISQDESVVRLIWLDYFRPELELVIQPGAFEPRKNETDGISVFRMACLADAREALAVIAEEKRDRYAIALLPVAALTALGLTVQPARIAKAPGHAVLPELNIVSCKKAKAACRNLQKQLAEIASQNMVHEPSSG